MVKFELVLQEARQRKKLNMVERQNLKRGGKAIKKVEEKEERKKVEEKEEMEEVEKNTKQKVDLKRGGKAIKMEEAAEVIMENKGEERSMSNFEN